MKEKKSTQIAQINESKVRLIAFFVFVLTMVYVYSNLVVIPLFLMIDFLLRSFPYSRYSLLGWLSDLTVQVFKLPFKPVYYPPKRFAARIGLLFASLITAFCWIEWNTTWLASVLMLFAFLESVFGFCAGCYVYNFFIRK